MIPKRLHTFREIRERRRRIAELRARQYTAEEIFNALKEGFPKLTLKQVYHDIEWIKENAKDYIMLEYLPNVADIFQQAVAMIDYAIEQAEMAVHMGIEKRRTIIYPDGTKIEQVEHIKDRRSAARLMADLAVCKVNCLDAAPVVANVKKLIDEHRRLKDQTMRVGTSYCPS